MNNTQRWKSTTMRFCTLLMLLTFVIQIGTIALLEADIDICEIEEIHEISGFVFLGLMFIHIIMHFKNLKGIFLSKTK